MRRDVLINTNLVAVWIVVNRSFIIFQPLANLIFASVDWSVAAVHRVRVAYHGLSTVAITRGYTAIQKDFLGPGSGVLKIERHKSSPFRLV
jgi:hypothetical protein